MDLVLRARARVHELLAPRQPAPQHAAALVGHPHRLQLPRPQQPRQRARVQPVSLRPRLRDAGVIRADHHDPVDVRLEDPRDLPTTASHFQRDPIGLHQALRRTPPSPPACSAPDAADAHRDPPHRSRPRRSHGERPDRSLDRPTSTTPSSPPPPRLTCSGRTSATTTQTDTCSRHNPGKSQGRPNEKHGLEAHRANRPTRLRSPNKAPVPDRPTLRPGPDGDFAVHFHPATRRTYPRRNAFVHLCTRRVCPAVISATRRH